MTPTLSNRYFAGLVRLLLPVALTACLAAGGSGDAAAGGGRYASVTYAPSTLPGALQFGVTYTLWVPEGLRRVRSIIVHQHGCGTGACKGGETAAYDLHWQALARRTGSALLGPSYHQEDGQNCRLWCDPRNGSEQAFLRALDSLADRTGRREIATAPWCLWGHSGGGFWASLMQTRYPDRIVAIWFRSGTAYGAWEKGEIPKPEIPPAAMQIPMMCNPGAKENGDPRFSGAWTGSMAMFKDYRAKGAPIGFAPDPRTGHECGDSRYLAIPFFEACLRQRLPDRDGRPLRPVDPAKAWLAPLLGVAATPAGEFQGNASESVWLPDGSVARVWSEYVRTGAASDSTPPPAPHGLRAARKDGVVELAWVCEADFESGLGGFVILRDGLELARLPEKPAGRFGRPLFQAMSYHDTPERPLPAMAFRDEAAPPGSAPAYQVIAINSVGLRSAPCSPVRPPRK